MPVRVLLLLPAFGGIALGVGTMALAARRPVYSTALTTPYGEFALLAAGWALMLAAFALAQRRPAGRSAGLLFLAGCGWFLAEWDTPGAAGWSFSLGLALYAAWPAIVAHAALSFPTGHLRSWARRALAATGYAVTVGLQGVGTAVFLEPTARGCTNCPPNWWALADDPDRSTAMELLGVRAGAAWTTLVLCSLAWDLVRVSAARRRAIAPVTLCAGACLAAVGASYMYSLDRGFLGSDSRDGRLWLLQALALGLLSLAVLAGLLQARRTHQRLTRLVIELGGATSPSRLREAIGRRLGDPALDIAYAVEGGRHVDEKARPLLLPPPEGTAATPLRYGDMEIATLIHRPGLLDRPGAVDDLVSAVYLGLEHARLHAELLDQLTDLRASGARVVAAGDEERRRLERDLHDGAQQRLVGLVLGLRGLRTRAPGQEARLQSAEDEVRAAINGLRRLARGIYPVLLKDAGLAVALDALTEERSLRLMQVPLGRFPGVTESTAYGFVDRLTERQPATVDVEAERDRLVVTVRTDGSARPDLTDLADRVTTLAGTLTTPGADDTRWTLTLPLPPPDGDAAHATDSDRHTVHSDFPDTRATKRI
ncbi:sensor histidine kinase [Streptomyces sp. NPDC056464]|uniref:sensor histidine kinase n=1 Tax=Streptomyces sp. NPDC056464 TaxID=3345828 RepID=UPI00368EEA29